MGCQNCITIVVQVAIACDNFKFILKTIVWLWYKCHWFVSTGSIDDIFNDACDPVQLGEVSISSVSWADDLLLLSTSVTGLQRCLDLLHAYCYKWGIHVYTLKTKAMVLTKQRYKTERFVYYGTLLENVKSFNYLGFEISHNRKFSNLINYRVLKAMKTSNMVLQAIRTDKNVSVKLSLSLFDKQIYHILSYGCSVWSLPDTHNLIYLDALSENQKLVILCPTFCLIYWEGTCLLNTHEE